jgi:hypothetical protein
MKVVRYRLPQIKGLAGIGSESPLSTLKSLVTRLRGDPVRWKCDSE